MQSLEQTPQERVLLLEDAMKRFQRQLATFQDIVSNCEVVSHIAEFDNGVELEIANIFGSSSEMLEAYSCAKHGKASGWMNMSEIEWKHSTKDRIAISFRQRTRVLERCIANLMARRSILLNISNI